MRSAAEMQLVVVESPYAGNVAANVIYAQRCVKDCLAREEAPLASHLLYTQVLDDTIPAERALGVQAGFAWMTQAHVVAFYLDYGWSAGMKRAFEYALNNSVPTEKRTIGQNPIV